MIIPSFIAVFRTRERERRYPSMADVLPWSLDWLLNRNHAAQWTWTLTEKKKSCRADEIIVGNYIPHSRTSRSSANEKTTTTTISLNLSFLSLARARGVYYIIHQHNYGVTKNVNVQLKLRKRFILDLSPNEIVASQKKRKIDFPELSTAVWCICCNRSVKTVVADFLPRHSIHAAISIFGCCQLWCNN